jgi:hypothetical protein
MWRETMREGDPGQKLLTRSAAKASRRGGNRSPWRAPCTDGRWREERMRSFDGGELAARIPDKPRDGNRFGRPTLQYRPESAYPSAAAKKFEEKYQEGRPVPKTFETRTELKSQTKTRCTTGRMKRTERMKED